MSCSSPSCCLPAPVSVEIATGGTSKNDNVARACHLARLAVVDSLGQRVVIVADCLLRKAVQ